MTTVSDGKEIGNSFKKYFSYILFLIAECYIFFIFSLFPFFTEGFLQSNLLFTVNLSSTTIGAVRLFCERIT